MNKTFRWVILTVLAAGYLLTAWLGTVYHPWDTELEESGITMLDFSTLGKDVDRAGIDEATVSGRQDALLDTIREMLFSDSSDKILNRIANIVLSPVSDTAKSICMAVAYMGIGNNYGRYGSVLFSHGITYNLLVPIIYFLLFYFCEFARNRTLETVLEREDMGRITWVEQKAIHYFAEGIAAFLFLFISYWAVRGMGVLRDSGTFLLLEDAISSSDAFIVIPAFFILMALMCAFVLLSISVLACVVPYYLLMALPVFFAAWLPGWFPMIGRIILCFALEIGVISGLFPRLGKWLNLWNIFTSLLRGVRFILKIIFWPVRVIFRH